MTTELNFNYTYTVVIFIKYWTGQFSNCQLISYGVVRYNAMNIVHNLRRYVEKLQVPFKQLLSKLYKSPHMLLHSKPYCSEGIR
jgi:hypothetical protein